MLVICAERVDDCLKANCPVARSIDVRHFYRGMPGTGRDAYMACLHNQRFTIRCRKHMQPRGRLVRYGDSD